MEDPATRRRQPRNYLETLEQRVAQLESILQSQGSTDTHSESPYGSFSHDYPLAVPSPSLLMGAETPGIAQRLHSQPLPPQREKEDPSEMNDLASKVGMLNLAAGAEPHYLGPSSAVSLCRMISPALLQAVPRRPETNAHGRQFDMGGPYACPFPDSKACLRMSEAYFQHIHPQYPFLHEPTFRLWEARLLLSEGSDNSELDSLSLFFLYMVGHDCVCKLIIC